MFKVLILTLLMALPLCAEDAKPSFTVDIPNERVLTITPNTQKLYDHQLGTYEEFKAKVERAFKIAIETRTLIEPRLLVVEKRCIIGYRGNQPHLIDMEYKLGDFADVVMKEKP